jgi:hypothetical protein
MCEDAGCHVEVSWALEEHPDKHERKAAEARLLGLHREATGMNPPIQHGGRGVAAYLPGEARTSAQVIPILVNGHCPDNGFPVRGYMPCSRCG